MLNNLKQFHFKNKIKHTLLKIPGFSKAYITIKSEKKYK